MAPTLGQAKRIFWRPLMQDLRNPEARAFLASKPNNSELSIEFKSGTRLYLYSAEAFERVRGDGFKLFLCDETADPRFTDEVFSEVIRPALSDNLGTLVQVGTPKGRGRFYKEFKKGQIGDSTYDPRYESIQVTAIEAGLIDPSEVKRARDTLPTRAFRQEYEATFNASIGLVYDEWDESKHVVTAAQLPFAFDEVIVGVDWGVAKRGAMVVIGIDRVVVPGGDDYDAEEMPRVWILEDNSERLRPYSYSTDRENPGWWTIAQRIQREWSPRRWYCDPAGGEREANEAQAAGYLTQLQEAVSGVDPSARVVAADNKVSPGISAVQTFMHHDAFLKEEPRFRVLNTCKTFIREVENYRWATAAGATEDDDDGFEDRPVKKEDHVLDGSRYGIFTHFFSKRRGGRNDVGHEDRGG
jgi:hypothetical protein